MLAALLAEEAEFLVVGAHAMAIHGVPRATGDLDLWVRPAPDNVARVWRALQQFGAPVASLGIRQEDFARPDTVIQLGLPPRRIDLLTGISGVEFEPAWQTRVVREIESLPVPFLSQSLLIANKRASGRTKDLADVEVLERQNPSG
ncbi:MAG TPA: hypothetical protein VHQ65_06870 [Thermoanaerobaculia bacterium]|nr:hypothetical protein [Thermoanaerobaculia bacterium]